jgi:predicted nucleic acid-binding protein
MVVYDTYAWVEYFLGTDKGLKVRALLRKGGGYTPSIVLAEISRKYLREGVNPEIVRKRLLFIEAMTEIVNLTVEVALKAGETYLELLQHSKRVKGRTPSLADAVVYSIALLLGEDLVTGDKLFKELPRVLYIGD